MSHKASAALWLAGALLFPGFVPAAEPNVKSVKQSDVEIAKEFAEAVAGEPKGKKFIAELSDALRLMKDEQALLECCGKGPLPTQQSPAQTADNTSSILTLLLGDQTWRDNARKLLESPPPESQRDQLYKRQPVAALGDANQYRACVAVLSGTGVLKTGVLLGTNVVLTVAQGPAPDRVVIGNSLAKVDETTSRSIKKVVPHPSYRAGQPSAGNDICLLVLADEVAPGTATPATLADRDEIESCYALRLVGYGIQVGKSAEPGTKSTCLLVVGGSVAEKLKARSGQQLIVGGSTPEAQPCNGDSGAPLLTIPANDGPPKLVALVSTSLPGAVGQCGPSIAVRVDAHAEWIRSAAREHGGKLDD